MLYLVLYACCMSMRMHKKVCKKNGAVFGLYSMKSEIAKNACFCMLEVEAGNFKNAILSMRY